MPDTRLTFASLDADAVAHAVGQAIPLIATRTRPDMLQAMVDMQKHEASQRARDIIDMMVLNDHIARTDGVPTCQDTGSVWVCLEVGEELCVPGNVFSKVDQAVAHAYEQGHLRMSILNDALVDRTNTTTNTPTFTELRLRPGSGATLHVMLKGGGSDNASRVVMLPPGAGWEGICEQVVGCVVEKGSSACPPLMLGIGVGATFDKVASLAKHALLCEVGERNPNPEVARLELELLALVNATGVGPAGLGGATTALDVHIETAPCHIAALPLAINMGCCATRSISFELEGQVQA